MLAVMLLLSEGLSPLLKTNEVMDLAEELAGRFFLQAASTVKQTSKKNSCFNSSGFAPKLSNLSVFFGLMLFVWSGMAVAVIGC